MPPPTVRQETPVASSRGPVRRWTVDDGNMRLRLLEWGASIQSLQVAGHDLVLGYDDVAGYERDQVFLGAVVGRYSNRIADGRFVLDGVEHRVAVGPGGHALHGGPEGFHRQVWRGEEVPGGVCFALTSRDGDMGFPGTLDARVTYTLDGGGVRIEHRAVTDRPTVVSLTQHAYLNLAGDRAGPHAGVVDDHLLELAASRYLPVDRSGIPLPGTASVAGTPFDFREAKPVGRDLGADDEQLRRAGGYDHAWLLDDPRLDVVAATLVEPSTGRSLRVRTDAPTVQFYDGHHLGAGPPGRGGTPYRPRAGLCLETQRWPDGPNRPDLGPVVLRPGEEFRSTTVWELGSA